MKREWIRNLIALLVLGGLVVFVSLGRKKTFETTEKEDKAKKIAQISPDKIDRVVVTNESGRMVFERRPKDEKGAYTDAWKTYNDEFDSLSDWAVTEPYRWLSDAYSVKSLLDNIKELTSTKVVDEFGSRPGEYNLKTPPLTVELYEKGKTPAFTLKVGDANPANSGLYIQTSTNPQIVLTSMTLDSIKKRKPAEWRGKEILGFKDAGKVTKIDAEYDDAGKKRVLAATKENGEWRLAGPLPAEAKALDGFIGDIRGLRLNDIVSDAADADAKKFGLDRPYAKITVTSGKDKDAVQKTFWIGSKIEKDKDIYVRRADFPQVFSVPPAAKTSLTKTVSDWIERKPFGWSQGDIDSLAASRPEGASELKKESGAWKLKKPVADAADTYEVNALLAKVTDLKAKEYLPKLTADKTKPWLTLKIGKASAFREVAFFKTKDEKIVEGLWLEPNVAYRFEKTDVDPIVAGLENLREKRLMPFDSNDAVSLEVKRGKLAATFEKKEAADWKATRIDGAAPDAVKKLGTKETIESIVRGIETLKVAKFIDDPKNLKKDEQISFSAKSKNGTSVSWSIGSALEGKRLVWSKERGIAGEVPEGDVEEVEKLLTSDTKPKG